MTKQRMRGLIVCAAVVVLGILFFIVAKWLLFVLILGLIVGGVVFATEAAKEQTAVRPPIPVYHPIQMPAEQPAPYTQGYQVQSSQKSVAPGFPFGPGPANAEPQPHQDRPGQIYEDPLVQYPEQ